MTSVYSALAADKLVFNSEYNRDSFFQGARRLFEKMPDGTPKDMLSGLPARTAVIPVPIRDELSATARSEKNQRVEIVWNHRWEYDKQPQVFFAAVELLLEAGFDVALHIVGQSFREIPSCFIEFREAHNDCIATWGFQKEAAYHRILQRSDIVVSTAVHDFQGIGMLEAIAMGCTPVAPNRMAYPEYISEELLYRVESGSDAETGEDLEAQRVFQKLASVIENPQPHKPDVQRYRASELLPVYDQLIDHLIGH